MPRQNLIFMIVAPLVVMAFIAIGVIAIGETLLAVGAWAEQLLDVEHLTGEEQRRAEEIAKLYPVGVALLIGALALLGGSIASRLAGPSAAPDSARH